MPDPFDDPFRLDFPAFRPRPEYRVPLPQDQLSQAKDALIGKATGGLQWLGSSLNKPGRAVRGLLGGKLHEGLAAIPFSDSLGITNPDEEVKGRDLTDAIGLTSKYDKGWAPWGLGLGAELITDPLTYASFGAKHAVTPLGKVAANLGASKGWSGVALRQGFHATEPGLLAAGKTAEEIAHMANQGQRIAPQGLVDAATKAGIDNLVGQPLGGFLGVGLPFSSPAAVFGTGELAQNLAGKIGQVGRTISTGNQLGRSVGALFDHARGGLTGQATQEGMIRYGTPALQQGSAGARGQHFEVLDGIAKLRAAGLPERDLLGAARAYGEGGHDLARHLYGPDLADAVRPLGEKLRAISPGRLVEAERLGLPLEELKDEFISHLGRSSVDVNPGSLGVSGGRNAYPVASAANRRRLDVLRDVPGGTELINRWSTDPALSGAARTLSNKDASSKILADMQAAYQATGGVPNANVGAQLADKADQVARYLKTLHESHAANSVPLFSPNLAGDVFRFGQGHAQTVRSGEAILGTIGDIARPLSELGPGAVPIPVLTRKMGLRTRAADAAAGTQARGAWVELYRKLAKQGLGPVDPLLQSDRLRPFRRALMGYGVSPEHAAEITGAYQKLQAGTAASQPLRWVDDFTNAFKSLTYPLWPASHVRNATTAALNNLRSPTGLGDYAAQYKLMRDTLTADEVRRILPDLPAGASDEAARAWLRAKQYSAGNVYGGHNATTDLANSVAQRLASGDEISAAVPGTGRVGSSGTAAGDLASLVGGSLRDTAAGLKDYRPSINPLTGFGLTNPGGPLQMQGVAGALEDFPLLHAGRQVGTNIEDFFRGAQMLGEMRSGATPAIAAERMQNLHFDYGALTDFERKVMKRAVPFYTFSRKNLPLQLETAVSKPGVLSAQLRPLAQSDPNQYVPEYLASSATIPLGQEQDGKQQFVSSLGLPIEEALDKVQFTDGRPDLEKTVMRYLGATNPLIKGPLERIFDTQLFSGRRLSDLTPPQTVQSLGELFGEENPALLAQLAANTPMTRFFTGVDKLTDPRKSLGQKAVNLLSGVRVSDVDVDKMRAIDSRHALEETMRQHPHVSQYTSFYVRPEDRGQLTPEEIGSLRTLAAMQQAARQANGRN